MKTHQPSGYPQPETMSAILKAIDEAIAALGRARHQADQLSDRHYNPRRIDKAVTMAQSELHDLRDTMVAEREDTGASSTPVVRGPQSIPLAEYPSPGDQRLPGIWRLLIESRVPAIMGE